MRGAGTGTGPKVYTLEECREMALQNNVKTRNAANELEAARHDKKQAFTNYFPTISASGMAYNANKGLLSLEMDGAGMSLLKNGVMGGVTATQPLFAGGQIVNGNRLAAVGVEVSSVRKEQSEDDVLLTVEEYYWQVVTLQEKLHTLNAIEKQLESIQKDAEMAVQAGVKNRNDLLQVQLKHNDVANKRINLESNLSVCRMLLAQFIGSDNSSIAVDSHIPIDYIPPFPYDIRRDHTDALPTTTGYRLSESGVRASRLQQKIAAGQNMPSVAVGAGYMYDDLMDKSHPFAVGFVSVSIPISGWWGGSHAIKKQKLNVISAENQLADNSERLVIAMEKTWADMEDAHKQIAIAHNSIEQSAENLRLNEDYYRAGTSTMSDLLDAQSLFQQSRDNYVDAYARFRIKTVEYMQATGQRAAP